MSGALDPVETLGGRFDEFEILEDNLEQSFEGEGALGSFSSAG